MWRQFDKLFFSPLGGSFVNLSEFYKIDKGNDGEGYEVSQILNLLWTSVDLFWIIWISFSNSNMNLVAKWQFYKITQVPFS